MIASKVKSNNFRHLPILIHSIFWFFSIGLMLFFFFYNEKGVHFSWSILLKSIFINIGFAFAVYINLKILIPRFLQKKSYTFYFFWLLVLLSLSSIFIQFLLIFPLRNILDIGSHINSFDINLYAAYFSATLIYVIFTSLLKFIKDWLTIQDLNLKLAKIEQQKLEAELKTLKSQLNPHFLFNSLNNIYSLSLIQSEKVPDLILMLSELMRHIIYETKEKYISLNKELNFVSNYISLQKIRNNDNVKINYQTYGTIPSAKIAPLLFEPFIDNAFKHGLPGAGENDFINITFDFTTDNWLYFKISNNYEPIAGNSNNMKGGIGLSNVKHRLKLLYSPSDYSLDIVKQDYIHTINLRLKLKRHENKSTNSRR